MKRSYVPGILIGALLILAAFHYVTEFNTHEISIEELGRLTETSQPRWDSYQEDIKGQIGARPVALWEGEPVSARAQDGVATVTFVVRGPWATYGAAIPLLLRGPEGAIHRHSDVRFENNSVIYIFGSVEEPALAQTVPWVLIKYPHNEKRLPLSPAGTWQAE